MSKSDIVGNKGRSLSHTASLSRSEKGVAVSLDELLQSSRNLPRRSSDIGTLHLGLTEIKRKAYDMRKYNKKGAKPNPYTKAHYLMIGKGITLEDIQDELDSIDFSKSHINGRKSNPDDDFMLVSSDLSTSVVKQQQQQQQQPSNLNINGIEDYVNVQRNESILGAIEQSLSASARDFDNYVGQSVSVDWRKQNGDLRQALSGILKREQSKSNPSSPTKHQKQSAVNGFTSSLDTSNKSESKSGSAIKQLSWKSKPSGNILSAQFKFEDVKSRPSMSSIGNPNVSYALRRKFELYAQAIFELNNARQAGRWYPLCTVFVDLSKRETTTRSKQMHEGWLILRDFCGEEEAEREEERESGVMFIPFSSNNHKSHLLKRPSSLEERKFAKAYNSESLMDTEAIHLRSQIAAKSKAYLESQFLDHINELYIQTVKKTDVDNATLVSNVTRVRHYVDLTLKTKSGKWKVNGLTFVNGQPIWAVIFYLLRAGCYSEANKLVSDNEDCFKKIERAFPTYMKAYCERDDHTLPPELQGRITNEFNQYFRRTSKEVDPYRYAIYKLIGRCDLLVRDLPGVTLTIEDWLWFHLGLVRETVDSSSGNDSNDAFGGDNLQERYTLADLQKAVLGFGSAAFNASKTNLLYLQTLLLTGQYEEAVKYLFGVSEIDSVHLAITLAYYGLLRVPDEKKDPKSMCRLMSTDKKGYKSINYARLLGYYVRSFKTSDPRVAAEYLFEICLCDGLPAPLKAEQIEMGQRAIRELVLETREFVMLLGVIDKDGHRVAGVIEQRKKLLCLDDKSSYLHRIAEKAAHKAEEEGSAYDCILLYQLSEEYDTVLELVNRLLGEFMASVDFRTPLEDVISGDLIEGETNIVKLARRLMKTYGVSPEIMAKTSSKKRQTCNMLLELVSIATDFTSESPDLVKILSRVKDLGLTPCSGNMSLDRVREKAEDFNTLDEPLAINVPNVLIIEMSCISQLLYELQHGYDSVEVKAVPGAKPVKSETTVIATTNASKEERMDDLRKMSRNCMICAGMLEYKMPRKVYRTLIGLEVDI